MARTKSGLTIQTIELEHDGVRQTLVQEHSWLVRFTHWLTAFRWYDDMSGCKLYAFPSLEQDPKKIFCISGTMQLAVGGWPFQGFDLAGIPPNGVL